MTEVNLRSKHTRGIEGKEFSYLGNRLLGDVRLTDAVLSTIVQVGVRQGVVRDMHGT